MTDTHSSSIHVEKARNSELLTQTNANTPCGEYMRSYWHPFMLESELKDLPIAIKLFGEELVVFRDRSNRIGLLHKHCAHRGASLEFGIPADQGIQCCYHGWKFDIDGTILETPAEPATSTIKERFRQGSYPVRELHGLLFTYMGPKGSMPELPILDTFCNPSDNQPVPFRVLMPCNWLQVVENACDPIHNAFLHVIVSNQFASSFKVLPALDFIDTPIGFLSMATRNVKGHVFVRASDIIMPNVGQFTGASNNADKESFRVGCGRTRWVVPLDDGNCHYIGYVHFNEKHKPYGTTTPEDYGVERAGFIGQTDERPYQERQREPGDYDAVVSQGLVANRVSETLGVTDRGIVKFRRMLTTAIMAHTEKSKPDFPCPVIHQGVMRTYAHEYALKIQDPEKFTSVDALQVLGKLAALAVVEGQFKDLPAQEIESETKAQILKLINETYP